MERFTSGDFENVLPLNEEQQLLLIKCEKVKYSGIKPILMLKSLKDCYLTHNGWLPNELHSFNSL